MKDAPIACSVLVVDDEPIAVANLAHVLRREGYEVREAGGGPEALLRLQEETFHVVLTDLRMDEVDGMAVLRHCRQRHPDTEVILITAHASLPSAVEAMKEGAFYYLEKPFKLDEVRQMVREAAEKVRLKRENSALKGQLAALRGEQGVVTQNEAMNRLLGWAERVAGADGNILITGESGTGKEVLARHIHRRSPRAGGPFVAINCGAFPPDLLAGELFGYEKGAFTGATQSKKGLIETADGGILFLDEITEMPAATQVTLLRVIQDRMVQRLGATRGTAVNVRFIAATNRPLKEALESKRLRQDIYYRLNTFLLHLPPLSARADDIPLLALHFLRKNAPAGRAPTGFSPEAIRLLCAYPYPGNVRELENIVERARTMADGNLIEPEHLPEDLRVVQATLLREPETPGLLSLEEHEKRYIRWVLDQVDGNKTKAAAALEIDRSSLWRKLKEWGLD